LSGYLFCALAFITCLLATAVNWRHGLGVLLVWGYFFGILKAHFFASMGHFIFDAATVGFYAALIVRPPTRGEKSKWAHVLNWVIALSVWPLFMAMVPIQHYLVQLVGLRGNMFWLPGILVGAMLDRPGRTILSYTLAILNIIAFSFALGEYFLGVEVFIPENDVTLIVFNSSDIAGNHKRIPSTFTNAHAYAMAMLATLPWILGEIVDRKKYYGSEMILVGGLITGIMGIFVAGPRLPVAILGTLFFLCLLTGRVNIGFIIVLAIVGTIVGYFVAQNERMQRFTELQNIDAIVSRITGYEVSFLDVLLDHPMGNGMGAGGTSLPGFAQALLERGVILENEYARILLEQGLPGLLLWVGFIIWFIRRPVHRLDPYKMSKFLIWFLTLISFSTAIIGTGLMTSIPTTLLFFVGIGYLSTPFKLESQSLTKNRNGILILSGNIPAYQRGLVRA
jgi:hypothetical protein